jgi:hypothetical protein
MLNSPGAPGVVKVTSIADQFPGENVTLLGETFPPAGAGTKDTETCTSPWGCSLGRRVKVELRPGVIDKGEAAPARRKGAGARMANRMSGGCSNCAAAGPVTTAVQFTSPGCCVRGELYANAPGAREPAGKDVLAGLTAPPPEQFRARTTPPGASGAWLGWKTTGKLIPG